MILNCTQKKKTSSLLEGILMQWCGFWHVVTVLSSRFICIRAHNAWRKRAQKNILYLVKGDEEVRPLHQASKTFMAPAWTLSSNHISISGNGVDRAVPFTALLAN